MNKTLKAIFRGVNFSNIQWMHLEIVKKLSFASYSQVFQYDPRFAEAKHFS